METATDLGRRLKEAPLRQIGARLRQARKDASLSHDQVVALIGTSSRQHLIALEKGLHRPRLALFVALAEATGKDPEWFLEVRAPFLDGNEAAA